MVAALALIPFTAHAQPRDPRAAVPQIGPLGLQGELEGAPYRIQVPEQWNGVLLVWAHGYRDAADHAQEIDNRIPETSPTVATSGGVLSLDAFLLARGYALAGTAFSANGWAVEEGLEDIRRLTRFFRSRLARPQLTILWGASLGSVVVLETAERGEPLFDGAMTACTIGAGATRTWDLSAALLLAYDALFGMPVAWGTPADVRDDLDFETEVLPKLLSELNDPANFPLFELLRLVAGAPGRGIQPPGPPVFYPGWVVTTMFFATEGRAELERRAGGAFVQNLSHTYTLTADERAYLASLGVTQVDAFLHLLNERTTIVAERDARRYVSRFATYTGRIRIPLVSIHTIVDPLIPVSHERALGNDVREAGRSELIAQAYTTGIGHCAFTPMQFLLSLDLLIRWAATGQRPSPVDFPSALGFVPDFVPPRMPQP